MPETKPPLKVFLCHASQDKPIVRELAQRLHSEGWIDPWLDEKKLLPGQDWRLKIEEAVETSDIVVICLSNNSVSREGFVQKELRYAKEIALEKPDETIFLIPLRLEECETPRGLRFYQWGDYFGEKKDETFTVLLQSLELRYQQKLMLEEKARARQERERLEREAAEKAVREREEREGAEKAAREKLEHETAERNRKEKAESEAAEKAAREKLGADRKAKVDARLLEEKKLEEGHIAKVADEAVEPKTVIGPPQQQIRKEDLLFRRLIKNIQLYWWVFLGSLLLGSGLLAILQATGVISSVSFWSVVLIWLSWSLVFLAFMVTRSKQ